MFRRIQCLQIALLLCVGVSSMAGAACGRWTTKTLPGPDWTSPSDYCFMAYEENLKKLVLLIYQVHGGDMNLWTYGGANWELLWSGVPPTDPDWHFAGPYGLVFDKNRGALVIICDLLYQLPGGSACVTAYQFLPGLGWERIYGCMPLTASAGDGKWVITYDTNRKRAILVGAGEYVGPAQTGPPVTVEFDGWAIEIKKNPPDYKLYYGSAGFNPETGKTVFYGYGRELEEEVLETFEYDGTTWTVVETNQRPVTKYNPISGLSYAPELHGLIGVPSKWEPMQTWLYKKGEWSQVDCGSALPARSYGILQWDSIRNVAVYWGGEVEDATGIHDSLDTLEFKAAIHCRPAARPSRPPQ